eukprot:283930-Pleurochrysis_carterae.AAC.1
MHMQRRLHARTESRTKVSNDAKACEDAHISLRTCKGRRAKKALARKCAISNTICKRLGQRSKVEVEKVPSVRNTKVGCIGQQLLLVRNTILRTDECDGTRRGCGEEAVKGGAATRIGGRSTKDMQSKNTFDKGETEHEGDCEDKISEEGMR